VGKLLLACRVMQSHILTDPRLPRLPRLICARLCQACQSRQARLNASRAYAGAKPPPSPNVSQSSSVVYDLAYQLKLRTTLSQLRASHRPRAMSLGFVPLTAVKPFLLNLVKPISSLVINAAGYRKLGLRYDATFARELNGSSLRCYWQPQESYIMQGR
jgi:hypothetical protein